MSFKNKVLLVEDDEGIRNFMAAILATNNYHVLSTAKGRDAISMAASHCPDIILLDLGLPDVEGLDVLRSIRSWTDVPVIIVSARGYENEKVKALDLGADDFVTKPFGTQELLARIRTAIRHKQKTGAGGLSGEDKICIGGLILDVARRIVSVDGREVHLTPMEYKIVLLLAQNAGRVITNGAIAREIWGPYAGDMNALRVNMANIRRKIETNPAEPRYILTEVGVGYRMAEG